MRTPELPETRLSVSPSDRPDPERCEATGKRRMTRKKAMAEASWWRRFRFARMNHYRCSKCGAWHVGNDRRRPRRRTA